MKHVVRILIYLWAAMMALPAAASDVIALKRGLPVAVADHVTGDEFAMAKAAGFDFIRLTIDPATLLTNRNPKQTGQLLDSLKTTIDKILAARLKVVVDMHAMSHDDGAPGVRQVLGSEALFAAYLLVVGDIGRSIAVYTPDKVAFEVMNEPTSDCDLAAGDKQTWPAKLHMLHKAARAASPNFTIILSGACWGSADALVSLDPKQIKDRNVIWSFHNYEPFMFTHQGAAWNDGHEHYIAGLRFPPQPKQKKVILAAALKAIDEAGIPIEKRKALKANSRYEFDHYFEPGWAVARAKEPFVKVEAWAKTNGVSPDHILLGEFGAIRPENFDARKERERADFYKLMRAEAETRGFGWSIWEWRTEFGVSKEFNSRGFDPVMMTGLMAK
jgi:endoglucanase